MVATVHRPVIAELARRGMPFRGCLYAGLMLTDHGPSVLEFNARWGDPETQALVPRLEGDLLDALRRCAEGTLRRASLDVSGRRAPRSCWLRAGIPTRPSRAPRSPGSSRPRALDGVTVFHAGTALEGGRLVVAGGRVLNVSAVGADLAEARDLAYRAAGADQLRRHAAAHRHRGAGRV